ncbi:MAG: TonB-dependent siderophore receptor [Cyanobacteria bacterium P01_E01_bin.42]
MLHSQQALPILLSIAVISSSIVFSLRSPNVIAQEAFSQAEIASITNIHLQPSETGLDLILETNNAENIQVFAFVDGNTLILDLVGARLDIGSESYRVDNPTDAVSFLTVEIADAQTARITIAGIATLPEANPAITGEEFIVSIPSVADVPQPKNPSEVAANIAEITNIQLQSIPSGVQLILETPNGYLIQPFSSEEGETSILDLVNAQLNLTDRYSIENPIEEVSSLRVEPLDESSIRITIVGIETLPKVNLSLTETEFIVDIPSAAAIARSDDSSDLRALRIGVVGREYAVEDISTATRTDTLLKNIPISIQVIPKQVLEDQQIVSLNDALRNVSGVGLSEDEPRGQRFIVRGFESASILRDGLPLTFGISGNNGYPELAHLDRIEVLKGPASILLGAVEPGGVINLVSERPQRESSIEFGLTGGNRDFFSSTVDITGPFSADGRSLYRVNALYRRENYHRDYDIPVQRYFFAPVLSFEPNDRTNINIFLEYLDEERPTDFGLLAIGTEVADVPSTRIVGEPSDRTTVNSFRLGYNVEHRFSDNWKILHAFHYSRYDTILESASPAFEGNSLDETTGILTRNFLYLEQPSDAYGVQTSLIGEFNTGEIEHVLLLGFDFFRREVLDSIGRGDFSQVNTLDIFNPVYGQVTRPAIEDMTLIFDRDFELSSWGFYLQDLISLRNNLKVLIGGRYDTVRQRTIDRPVERIFFPPSDRITTGEAFSPRVGIVYQPLKELSLYTSYSRSFSPNTGLTVAGETIAPERGEQFEVGARAELLDGDLILNLAYFDLTKQNISQSDPDNPGFFTATGEQQSQGIEFDIIGEILPGWNIVANYAYIDAKTTRDETVPIGNRLFGVPENSANFWTTYEFPRGALGGLSIGIGFNAVGERQGDNKNSFSVAGYFLTNAAIAYHKDKWRIGLNFRNLFDVDYIESTQSRVQVQPGRGFTAIGSFAIEF